MKLPKSLREKIKLLRKVNTALSVLILIFALSLSVMPYLPEISYAFSRGEPEGDSSVSVSANKFIPPQVIEALGNNKTMLFIPSIGVAEEIMESDSIEEIHEKIWRRPYSSTPPSGSNTVLVAHRYATIGGNRASTFYHLPKVIAGEDLYLTWGGKVYHYRVSDTEIVSPTNISIEDRSLLPTLTLYTCTPLWKADKRFVVHGSLIEMLTYEEITTQNRDTE